MVDADVMKGPTANNTTTKDSSPRTTNTTTTSSKNPPERESKLARVKRMLTCQPRSATNNTSSTAPLTYDEAKASVKARKRKERQESITSIAQERKQIRSNSEERPVSNRNDIRRVSSHEDFQKNNTHHGDVADDSNRQQQQLPRISPQKEVGNDGGYVDEYEKRRSHERFSRPLVQRNKYNSQGRKPKSKQFSKSSKDKLNAGRDSKKSSSSAIRAEDRRDVQPLEEDRETTCNFLQLHREEKDNKERSPSPVHTPISPALDLSTLHQQIDCTEPLPSTSIRQLTDSDTETLPSLSIATNRLLSSPRNSVIITQRIYLNPDVPQTTMIGDMRDSNQEKNPLVQRQKQLTKQINGLKKKVKKYDEEFEGRFGYRPSHADKLNDRGMKKMCAELSKLKKEQKQLNEDVGVVVGIGGMDERPQSVEVKEHLLQDTVHEIEKKLNSKRSSAERSKILEDMSSEQLVEEKVAVQKALLYLESLHGRPTNKEDKDLARPLYDRYRALKRMVARLNMTNSINELATIHEHETMDFVSLPAQISETETDSDRTTVINTQFTPLAPSVVAMSTSATDSSDTDTSIGENLHALTLDELYEQQRTTAEDKKQLRRALKLFEHEFEERTGRKLQKEDKQPMETVYVSYKKAKAKLRLLDALVGKQQSA